MFYVKYIFFFLVFFLVHYLEGLPPIGSLSVAQLWKLPLLGVLLIYNITRVYRYTSIEKSGY
ncbi:MAG: O-antigen ligase domain-containing protein, partial [Alistipes sp.]|nr:O-antigen ligase domain-containing protein [Alistipes sp.]